MRLLLICLISIMGQICVSVFLVTPNYTRKQIALEYQSIKSEFGQELASKVVQRANIWLAYVYLDKTPNRGRTDLILKGKNQLERMAIEAYRFPENYQYSLYQLLLRFSFLSMWLPVLLSIFMIFVLEGISQRRKRKSTFAYSTVERNRIAIRLLATSLIVISLLSVSTIAIPALTFLIVYPGLAIISMTVIASSKRSL